MVAPTEWLEQALQDPTLDQMPVGQGPFIIESRVQDEVTVLVRNPDYWATDLIDIHLDRIEIYPIYDTAIAAERIAAGDLDMAITSDTDAILILREAESVKVIEQPLSGETVAVINSQSPPFDDIRARQALTFASDRDAHVELIRQGTAPAADTMFHPDLVWHNPDVKQETNMPERAGPLVDAYCADHPGNCSDGRINMRLLTAGPSVENTRIAHLQINAWRDFFNVALAEKLQGDVVLDVVLGNYDTVNLPQFGAVDPDLDVPSLECSTAGFIALNFPRYCDPERDELMYEQRRIDDLDRRVEIWHEIQEMIRDSYIYIFHNHINWTIGARDNVDDICGQTSPDGVELWCNNQGRALLNQIRLTGAAGQRDEPTPTPDEPTPTPNETAPTPPATGYQAVAIGSPPACGLRTDGTITCWWGEFYGSPTIFTPSQTTEIYAPQGTYKAVTAGGLDVCAIRTDDTLACWWFQHEELSYARTSEVSDLPAGTFKAISTGSEQTCAIRTDDTLTCWATSLMGDYPDYTPIAVLQDAPAGTYKTISGTCAIGTDDTITCWGNNRWGQADAPAGTYKTISGTCAIGTDDTITCWGNNDYGQADAPAGTYKTISGTCAIGTDDTITCWGFPFTDPFTGQPIEPPQGSFAAIANGDFACAISTDGMLTCWGGQLYECCGGAAPRGW